MTGAAKTPPMFTLIAGGLRWLQRLRILPQPPRDRTVRCPHLGTQPGESLSASHRKEFARLNWKTFLALLSRDAHVVSSPQFCSIAVADFSAADDVCVYFRPGHGEQRLHARRIQSLLLPGIMAISMVFTGVWAVAMPLISEFQFTREIEDRLLAFGNRKFVARDRESIFWHDASADCRSGW